jgi:hypothetical protein
MRNPGRCLDADYRRPLEAPPHAVYTETWFVWRDRAHSSGRQPNLTRNVDAATSHVACGACVARPECSMDSRRAPHLSALSHRRDSLPGNAASSRGRLFLPRRAHTLLRAIPGIISVLRVIRRETILGLCSPLRRAARTGHGSPGRTCQSGNSLQGVRRWLAAANDRGPQSIPLR